MLQLSDVMLMDQEGGRIGAYWNTLRIGYLNYSALGDRTMLLGDVWVEPIVPGIVSPQWIDVFLRRQKPRKLCARSCGVGTLLLKNFLKRCDREGIREVFGNVTKEADLEQPFLKGWYEKMGFRICSPDGRSDFGDVIYKIVRTRPT